MHKVKWHFKELTDPLTGNRNLKKTWQVLQSSLDVLIKNIDPI